MKAGRLPLLLCQSAFCLLLVSLPWWRGGVLPAEREVLERVLLLLGGCFWLAWLLASYGEAATGERSNRKPLGTWRQRFFAVPGVMIWAAMIAGWGWLMALSPRAFVDSYSGAILFIDPAPRWIQGTYDRALSLAEMRLLSGVLLLLLAAWVMGASRDWRRLLRAAVICAGATAAAAGLMMKMGALPQPIWPEAEPPSFVFGFFWYHANAASFLNLSLAFVIWSLCDAFQRGSNVLRSWMVLLLALHCAALFVNVSKAGHALAVMQMALIALLLIIRAWRRGLLDNGKAKQLLVCGVPLAALMFGLVWQLADGQAGARWKQFSTRSFTDPGRQTATELTWQMARDGSWFGFGPGTFEPVFAHYSARNSETGNLRWRHAHNDLAQTVAEWGWLGCLIGLSVPLYHAARWLRRGPSRRRSRTPNSVAARSRSSDYAGRICLGAGLFTLGVHAYFDFPLQVPVVLTLVAVAAGIWLGLGKDPAHKAI